jgi:Tfp pilus assembly protein PilV
MNLLEEGKREEGYTLIETLVAMALLVSVLIPLGVSIGNMMVEQGAEQMNVAFHLAVEEMTRTGLDKDFTEQNRQEGAYRVQRTMTRGVGQVEVGVAVATTAKPAANLVRLSKTFLLLK